MEPNLLDKIEKIIDKIRKVQTAPYRGRELIDEIEEDILALFPEERIVWEKLSHTKSSEGNSILDQEYDPLSLNEDFYFR